MKRRSRKKTNPTITALMIAVRMAEEVITADTVVGAVVAAAATVAAADAIVVAVADAGNKRKAKKG